MASKSCRDASCLQFRPECWVSFYILSNFNILTFLRDPQTQLESIMEQSLKASGLNLGSQQNNAFTNGVNPFSNVPIMAAVAAAAVTPSRRSLVNFSLQQIPKFRFHQRVKHP